MNDKCIKCGKKKREEEFLCLKCYYELNPPIFGINQFSIVTCPKCNSYLIKGKWETKEIKKVAEELLFNSIKKNPMYEISIKIKQLQPNKNTYEIVFLLNSLFKKKKFSQELIYTAPLNKELCLNCSQKTSGYFEGILQVRGRKDKIISLIREEIITKPENYDIKSIDLTQFGFDVKFRSIQKVRKDITQFIDTFGGDYDFSTQLFSRNRLTSKDILRTNIRYNAPSFYKGEVIRLENDFYKIISTKNKIIVKELFSNQKIQLHIDPFKDKYEIISPINAQVIKTYPNISVLHPKTFEETQLEGNLSKTMISKLKIGEQIEVIIAKDKLFLVS